MKNDYNLLTLIVVRLQIYLFCCSIYFKFSTAEEDLISAN